MKLRTAIPSGIVDTGATALASFTVQVYAVRTFEPDVLGVYALFFSAYILASLIPQFLLLYPLEIHSLQLARAERIGLIVRSLRIVAITPVVAVAAVLLASVANGADVGTGTVTRLAVSSALVATVAPVYEHLKRMMHLSELSVHAAASSLVQLVGVAIALVVMLGLDVDPALVPFGALAISQVLAATFGMAVVRSRLAPVDLEAGVRRLVHSGRWLLVSGIVPAAASFVAAALVSRLASSDDLGFAQAAHVASRPILVLATGLSAVLAFRLMEAGAARAPARGARHWKLYTLVLVAGAAGYAALAAPEWGGNPVAALIPSAYEVGGLVAVSIAANLLLALARPPREELIGARREPWVAAIDTGGAAALTSVALFASVLESFAIPLGVMAAAFVHGVAYVAARRRLYRSPVPVAEL